MTAMISPIKKRLLVPVLVILGLGLGLTRNVSAGSAVFKIKATIPAIVGVNVFGDEPAATSLQASRGPAQDVLVQKVIRDNEEIILRTIVAR